jgi:hypothetical protein
MSLKAKLTAIANRIRTLLGVTDTMSLDVMASNLDTAQAEVDTQHDLISQIAAVLARKAAGIVPEGNKTITENGTYDVFSFANAIVDVSTLPAGVSKLAAGTFTPSVGYQTGGFLVEHGLGTTPNFCFLYSDAGIVEPFMIYAQLTLKKELETSLDKVHPWVRTNYYLNYQCVTDGGYVGGLASAPFDDTNLQFVSTETYKFKPGATYYWIAGVLDNLS